VEDHELAAVVKDVSVNWSLPTMGPQYQERCKLWWEYLHDLEFDLVNSAIKQIIFLDQRFAPRVGQVRRLAIDMKLKDSIPSPSEAWSQFRSAIDASESGIPFEKPHNIVGKTMRSFPKNGAGLRTNSDRELFLSAYERLVKKTEIERYSSGSDS
jgi:hypothetical protein